MESKTGIVLGPDKLPFVEARLADLKQEHSGSLESFLAALPNAPAVVQREVLESLTTHTTSFYREVHHFELLRDLMVPSRRRSPQEPLRVWSAGCSTGEESYTLAIELSRMESLGALGSYRVLGTDLSEAVVRVARRAVYSAPELEGLPEEVLAFGFEPLRQRPTHQVRVRPEIRRAVSFHRLNLIADDWHMRHRFDIIFCRNVLVYFESAVRERLIRRLVDHLLPGGFLVLGQSDHARGEGLALSSVGPTAYRKVGDNHHDDSSAGR